MTDAPRRPDDADEPDAELAARLARLPRELPPPSALWPGIADRIARRRRQRRLVVATAAAAAAVLAVAVLVRGPRPAAPGRGPAVAQGLPPVLAEEVAALAPSTAAAFGRDLAVIDAALGECREALAATPGDPFVRDQLAVLEGRRTALLQQALRLGGA